MPDAWLKLVFHAAEADVGKLETILECCGALAVTCEARDDVPIFDTREQGQQILWRNCTVEGLFDVAADPQRILARVAAAGLDLAGARQETLADRDWQRCVRDQFRPLCFGDRLWVCPSWDTPPDGADLVITLDPGMAFGTGTHPTTGLCLDWLAGDAAVAGRSVLDYGCGSGILAIAAAKLGARRVVAVDIDSDACSVTRENAARNGCAGIEILQPDALAAETFDVLVANLLLQPILALREHFAARLERGGRIALSGVLEGQAGSVLGAYGAQFTMEAPRQRGEWALVSGRYADAMS